MWTFFVYLWYLILRGSGNQIWRTGVVSGTPSPKTVVLLSSYRSTCYIRSLGHGEWLLQMIEPEGELPSTPCWSSEAPRACPWYCAKRWSFPSFSQCFNGIVVHLPAREKKVSCTNSTLALCPIWSLFNVESSGRQLNTCVTMIVPILNTFCRLDSMKRQHLLP